DIRHAIVRCEFDIHSTPILYSYRGPKLHNLLYSYPHTNTHLVNMSTPMINLTSSEGMVFNVPLELAEKSAVIMGMLKLDRKTSKPVLEETIPLPNVKAAILKIIIEYCTHHQAYSNPEVKGEYKDVNEKAKASGTAYQDSEDIEPWDREFCERHHSVLFDLILAANYLEIAPLRDLGCKTVANAIKGRYPEEIRKIFNIENDFKQEDHDDDDESDDGYNDESDEGIDDDELPHKLPKKLIETESNACGELRPVKSVQDCENEKSS
ncbi:Skp1 family, dimerization domain-containing protein, partial [Jimgerdemannia flammicorona]